MGAGTAHTQDMTTTETITLIDTPLVLALMALVAAGVTVEESTITHGSFNLTAPDGRMARVLGKGAGTVGDPLTFAYGHPVDASPRLNLAGPTWYNLADVATYFGV